MELKLDKTTKILLGAIALGLFLNASNVFIDKAYANDCATSYELNMVQSHLENEIAIVGLDVNSARRSIESTIRLYAP